MRFPPHILDEIRARLPVSAVVGRKVQLKKAGREWKGLSPFTAEKTPSFYVNDQKAFYHCFSSGQHGDIFTFLIETEGLSFPEAVERLAAEAGIDLPRATPEAEVQETRRRGLHDVMELAAAFFEKQLSGRGGGAAREYLRTRSLDAETQRRFRIGLAPAERFALRDHLAGRDVSLELMAEAGLVITGDEIAVPYDRFRDRVIFPIEDGRGRVVAFGGRALAAEAQAKYLNSPDTPLFSKGRLLYNQHRARGPAHDAGSVVAVEGYVDAIALSAIGVANVVAPLGTALTEDQLALMWRLADEAILCFDGDKAGRRAAYRTLDVALAVLPTGKSLRFAILPEGQDPDDLARTGGRPAIEAVLAGARPLVDMLWARETEAAPADTPESRAVTAKRLRDAIAPIRDDTLKRFFRAEIEKRIDTLADDRRGRDGQPFRGVSGRNGPWRNAPAAPLRASPGLAASALFANVSQAAPREALIVMILAAHPDLLDQYMGDLGELRFTSPDIARAARELLDLAAGAHDTERSLPPPDPERLAGLAGRVHVSNRRYADPAFSAQAERLLVQAMRLQHRRGSLDPELAHAEAELGTDASEEVEHLLGQLKAEIDSLDGVEATDTDMAEKDRPMDAYLDQVLARLNDRR